MKKRHLVGALAGAILITGMTACAELPSTALQPSSPPVAEVGPSDATPGSVAKYVPCNAQGRDSVSKVIGPNGGVIPVGLHKLAIPRDALSDTVTITAVLVGDSVRGVRFAPHGLTFLADVELTLDARDCAIGGPNWQDELGPPPVIVYVDQNDVVLETITTTYSPSQKTAVGLIRHFSGYALAW